jgi:hypothetical protein
MTIVVNCYDSQANPYCNARQNENVNIEEGNNTQYLPPKENPPQESQETPGIGNILNSVLEGLGLNKALGGIKNMLFGKSEGAEGAGETEMAEAGTQTEEAGIGDMLGEGAEGLVEEGAELLPELALL